jgi:Leucine-rich repeat (LRR) protein
MEEMNEFFAKDNKITTIAALKTLLKLELLDLKFNKISQFEELVNIADL